MTKNYILYCSIHTRWLEQTNLQKNKVDEWLPRMQSSGAGGREVPVNGYRIFFRGNGNVLKLDCVRVAQACARHGAKTVMSAACVNCFSRVTLWTVAREAPLSVGSCRQESWRWLGCHDLLQRTYPTQELNPHLFCLLHRQVGSLLLLPMGKPERCLCFCI